MDSHEGMGYSYENLWISLNTSLYTYKYFYTFVNVRETHRRREQRSSTMSSVDQELIKEVSDHLTEAWPEILQDWQNQVTGIDPKKRTVALVTRQCQDCDTQIRVGAVFNRLSTQRPTGDRAFCAECRQVTNCPIVDVHGMAIDE